MNATSIDVANYLHTLITGRDVPDEVPAERRLDVAMGAVHRAVEEANVEAIQNDLDTLVDILGGDTVPDAAGRAEAANLLRRMLARLDALGTGDVEKGEG